jgi:ferritin-like metal-binding protein YciE
MSKIESMNDLLEENLKDLYSAEKQLTKALPKMAKAANSPELKNAFESHLEETNGHIERLEKIGKQLDIKLTGKKCKAMEGLVEEGSEVMESEGDPVLLDAAIIVAAQKVEHYEIAAYGSVKAFAEKLGLTDIVSLLDETLKEESACDEKLTSITTEDLLSDYEGSEMSEERTNR